MATVLVFIESENGKVRSVAREACSGAKKISEALGADVIAINLGKPADDAATLGMLGVKKVIQIGGGDLETYSTEGFAQALAEVIKAEAPLAVVFSATLKGKDLAPRVAARVGRPLLTDCTDLKVEGGEVHALRPIYAGKVMMWAKVTGGFGVYSLRPKAFLPTEVNGGAAEIETRNVSVDSSKIRARITAEKVSSGGMLDVTEADIVVSGGRGLKDPANFVIVEDLAKALGGSVGASRAAVDAGWRPHSEQVGQTGKVVSPGLYIAVGISGAVQHAAGMSSSRTIVAVNKDKDAPIFKLATYGIVGDAMEVVPKLTEEIKKIKAAG
jgi:electron transfer flavoprotein alpha subunit